jgi:hypothetical protein
VRCGRGLGFGGLVRRRSGRRPSRGRGLGRRRLLDRLRVRLGAPLGLRLGLGLVDDGVTAEAFGVGQTADAIGRGVVDARRVALDADLELLGEIEHHLVLDAELSRQLVDADLLRCQAASSTSCSAVLLTRCVQFVRRDSAVHKSINC